MIWIGAIFIVLASALIGMELSKRLERRTLLLRHMKVALETFDTEVAFAMMPLSEALIQISRQLPDPAKQFLFSVGERIGENRGSVVEIWEEELDLWKKNIDLNNQDIEVIRQFGQTLGKQDLEGQRKQIQLTQSYLTHREQVAVDSQKTYQSMYRSLGFLGGLLLVIMLL
ncbi:stage III sporulation protein AB [Salipaludibacillus neizhouensis]|uniref:Stage III sporulation protein AB n=1 Tax=Salipaludibacillus neizhouensis TaxID=885475 RepID=A0A3A9KGR0_9BACI|nr:stage III sporulation protein SpoIIIAB [Salipaludibacillus neizhouensis]RKL68763.1 stage III sporulation protein AB [Salipaludibacillus neizhouensis]